MNELTRAMQRYRQCLMVVWNGFLAIEGDWDERVFFCNAAVELFRSIVLYYFDDDIRNMEILPAYRGEEKELFKPIRVVVIAREGVHMSLDGSFGDTRELSPQIRLDEVDMRYFDLFDFSQLGLRSFQYVKVEIVSSPVEDQVGIRLLVPFENAEFEPAGEFKDKMAQFWDSGDS